MTVQTYVPPESRNCLDEKRTKRTRGYGRRVVHKFVHNTPGHVSCHQVGIVISWISWGKRLAALIPVAKFRAKAAPFHL